MSVYINNVFLIWFGSVNLKIILLYYTKPSSTWPPPPHSPLSTITIQSQISSHTPAFNHTLHLHCLLPLCAPHQPLFDRMFQSFQQGKDTIGPERKWKSSISIIHHPSNRMQPFSSHRWGFSHQAREIPSTRPTSFQSTIGAGCITPDIITATYALRCLGHCWSLFIPITPDLSCLTPSKAIPNKPC